MNAQSSEPDSRVSPGKAAGIAVLIAMAWLIALETALQVRSQLRTGQSVLNVVTGRTTHVRDAETGLRLLRPSATVRGQRSVMHTNRYGLRGPDFDPRPAAGERRIAVLGSSTIMGTYASDDAHTSSALLESQLRQVLPGVRVINAGVAGLTISNQVQLLIKRVLPLGAELVVWYPGTNDLSCAPADPNVTGARVRVPVPDLPAWLILPDIVLKNTAWLREGLVVRESTLRPSADFARMVSDLRRGVSAARDAGANLVLVTPARAYAPWMPRREIERRARAALAFRPCYTGAELAALTQKFDEEVIRAVARDESIPLIDATRGIGTDPRLFGDSTHLSDAGERKLAELLADGILEQQLLQPRAAR